MTIRLLATFTLTLLFHAYSAVGQSSDSLSVASSDRNVMLNAESGSIPRAIPIGLPESGLGSHIAEDGMILTESLARPYYLWSGGNSYSSQGTLGISETVIKMKKVSMIVDSYTKLGGDKTEAVVTMGTSSNGRVRVDAFAGGKLGGKWYGSASAYINYDPTAVNGHSRFFVDKKQIYKLTLSRKTSDSQLDILYKLSICNDNVDHYSNAPFVYNGDGSISPFVYSGQKFRIGKDRYTPEDDLIPYVDVLTGEKKQGNMSNMDRRLFQTLSLNYVKHTASGWDLGGKFRFGYSPYGNMSKTTISGIDHIVGGMSPTGARLTLADGTPFEGYMQNRNINVVETNYVEMMGGFMADRKFARHTFSASVQTMLGAQEEKTNTVTIAHSVAASPDRILLDGQYAWNANGSSLYYKGRKASLEAYAIDEWHVTNRIVLRAGARGRVLGFDMDSCPILEGETCNKRTAGFNLSNGTARLVNIRRTHADYAAMGYASYNVAKGLNIVGEGFWSVIARTMPNYKGTTLPSETPSTSGMVRGGLMYNSDMLDFTLMPSYITSLNNTKIVYVTKQINGVSETQAYTAEYGIGTLGVTFDGNFHWRQFSMHALCTLQNPRYTDYDNEFHFSDGSTDVISYTGNYVSGLSRMMLELDPSWKNANWRVWASARYYSRQYASRTNNAWFNSHWETFAGVDRQISPKLKLALSLVNVLMQDGAKGSLDVADTITDTSMLEGYVMAGSYIRPFAVEMSLTWKL